MFVYSSDRTLEQARPFDVVFCMAVLRAPKKQQRLGNYPFALFEERAVSSSPWFGRGAYS